MSISSVEISYFFTYGVSAVLFALTHYGLYEEHGLSYASGVICLILGVLVLLFLPVGLDLLFGLFERSSRSVPIEVQSDKFPIVYTPHYNIAACGLEKMHPFDSQKYGRVFQRLLENEMLQADQVYTPIKASRSDLLLVHSPLYLAKLHYAFYLTSVVEVPVCFVPSYVLEKRVLEPMLYATGGSILAARLALSYGIGINIGGGYHHASASSGGGFCVYADITLAIEHLRRDFPGRAKKAMIVDLDAHQGNGHERDFLKDTQNTFILDMFNPYIYPGDRVAARAISKPVHVDSSYDDAHYLRELNRALESSIDAFQPDLIFYNAGTDCMRDDPLGDLNITPEGIIQRDEAVFTCARLRAKPIPIVMVLSGGYQFSNAPCIADSILNLNQKFQLGKNR